MQGINDAKELVEYAAKQTQFRQISQSRYLAATITRRVYHNITRNDVESPESKKLFNDRRIEKLDGNNIQGNNFS